MKSFKLAAVLILSFSLILISSASLRADDTSEAILKVLIKKGIITQKEVDQMKAELAKEKPKPPQGLEEKVAALEKKVDKGIGKVKISGVSYLQYKYETENQKDLNAFEITRGYLTLKGALSEDTKWRFTADLTRKSDGDLEYRLKYAYLTLTDLIPDAQLKLGQTQTSWLDWEEHIWGYRMQGTVFVDREGYLTSSDLGVSLVGSLGKHLEYATMLSNGEGYHAAESNKYKMGDIRLTYTPLPENDFWKNLRLTGYFQGGRYASNQDRYRVIGNISYKNDRFTLAGEYLYASDPYSRVSSKHPSLAGLSGDAKARGISVYGVLKFPDKWNKFSLIGRYDYLDPDNDVSDNSHYRYIYGISYRLNKNVRFLIDNDVVNYDSASGTNDANEVLLQSEIKF
jgi:hypothetical protein